MGHCLWLKGQGGRQEGQRGLLSTMPGSTQPARTTSCPASLLPPPAQPPPPTCLPPWCSLTYSASAQTPLRITAPASLCLSTRPNSERHLDYQPAV